MQITRATEYAVRCALHLAFEPRGGSSRAGRSRARGRFPSSSSARSPSVCRAPGSSASTRARGAAIELLVPASRLTLLAVVEAAEGDLVLNTCVMHPRTCSRTCVCAAHRVWAEARRQLRATLAGVTFAELAAQEGPLPNKRR